jgi:hypothetical protein
MSRELEYQQVEVPYVYDKRSHMRNLKVEKTFHAELQFRDAVKFALHIEDRMSERSEGDQRIIISALTVLLSSLFFQLDTIINPTLAIAYTIQRLQLFGRESIEFV